MRVTGEVAIAIGFPDIPRQYRPPGLVFIRISHSRTRIRRIVINRLQRLTRQLARWRLFSEIWVDTYAPKFVRTRALLPQIGIVSGRFLQVANLSKSAPVSEMVEQLLSHDYSYLVREQNFAFVHVRRGDFLEWPTPEAPAALPTSFFSKLTGVLRQTLPAADILVFSDDREFVARMPEFEGLEQPNLSPIETFLTLAQASGGILSPSSFSYWATLVAIERGASGSNFFAPRYWAGWRQGKWWPSKIANSALRYVDVDSAI